MSALESHFGSCPTCISCDDILNVGREHFAVCHLHRVRWHLGSNLFSGWRDEPEHVHDRNEQILRTYEPVEPVTLPDPGLVA